jgi:predicted Rossmann fold flavoprotein
MPDIAIIGGGAAGLAAAIFAAQAAGPARQVVILDGAKTLGAKILVSGGGRCNVTHEQVVPEDFNGSRPVVRNILAAFPAPAAVEWFASMGVQLKREDTGKLFPITDSARTVLNAMLHRCEDLGIVIQTASRVLEISAPHATDPLFTIRHLTGSTRAAVVLMATGGLSLPRTGSDGSGWDIARRLGHTITPTCAALAPLVLDEKMFHAGVSGIAHEVQLRTFVDGKLTDRREGNLLWTHFGISGPVVMDASRHWIAATESDAAARMEANFLPPESFETVEQWLIELASSRGKTSLANALTARLPDRIIRSILAYIGVDPAITCGQLSRPSRRTLVAALTAFPLPILRHRGWNYAEVTAGGVPLDEINFRTMESRKIPGLHLAGEMLDCDGRIGGFNFQWAWATGYLAGIAAAKKCDRENKKSATEKTQ